MLHSSKKRCAKCLSVITGEAVRDIDGQYFCSKFCLSEWWRDERKRNEELYSWWKGE